MFDAERSRECQPQAGRLHPTFMHQRQRGPRSCFLPIAILAVAAFTACTNNNSGSPDQIRQRTAEATETVRQDAKAIAEGVKEGMASDHKAININNASREDLLTLPGLNDRAADRIIADRPFENVHDLVTKRIVSQSEYDQIRDRVIAGH
jgi:hypothetical protein